MVEVTITNKLGKKSIFSDSVEKIIKNMADIVYISDISDSTREKNVMIFDCRLDNFVFKFDSPDESLYEEYEADQEYYQVLFEDINEYIYDLADDIEQDLRQIYKSENIKLHFEIYDLNENFSDIKFVIALSFKQMSMKELADLTRIIAKRQLLGSSKYFN